MASLVSGGTDRPGPPAKPPTRQHSKTSKAGITAATGIPASATSAPPPTKAAPPSACYPPSGSLKINSSTLSVETGQEHGRYPVPRRSTTSGLKASTVGMSWDDIEILRRIDSRQIRHGGGALTNVNGKDLMDEVAGALVIEDRLHRGFVRELHNARDAGHVLFAVDKMVGGALPDWNSNPYFYLQQVRGFALTTAGQDRARGRVVQTTPSDPDEDDGRPISRLVYKQVAESIENEYRPDQIPLFLEESGIPLDRLPLPETTPAGDVNAVLTALDRPTHPAHISRPVARQPAVYRPGRRTAEHAYRTARSARMVSRRRTACRGRTGDRYASQLTGAAGCPARGPAP